MRACGSIGERAAWQRRAPPGDALLRRRPLLAEQDRGAAAEARLALPAEDPVVAAAAGITGGVLLGVVQVGPHQRAGALDQLLQVGDVGDPGPRVHAADEQRLDLVEVADAGEVALVDQGDADLLVGVLAQPAQRLVEVPVGAEHVGPEMADEPVLLGGGHHVDVVQPVADALPVVGGEDQRGRRRPARRATSCRAGRCASCRPSGSACAGCGRRPAGSAGACRGARPRGRRRRSRSRVASCGIAELAPAQRAAGQRGVHPLRRQPDGVSLGHVPSVPGPRRHCPAGVSRPTTGMTCGARRRWDPVVSVPLRLRAAFGADVPTPPAEPVTGDGGPGRRVPTSGRPSSAGRTTSCGSPRVSPATSGASLLHPGPDSSEYHLVYRFEDDESLAAWERSSERRSALAHVEKMVDDVRYAAGLGPGELLHPVADARSALADDRC